MMEKRSYGLFLFVTLPTACGAQAPQTLSVVSGDPACGFSAENPILVGGSVFDGGEREEASFARLTGPDAQPVEYERRGRCCSPEGGDLLSSGPLDMYRVNFSGLEAGIMITGGDHQLNTLVFLLGGLIEIGVVGHRPPSFTVPYG